MRIMTGGAFPFAKGKMNLRPQKFLLHLCVALVAEIRDILFYTGLCIYRTTTSEQQEKA